MTPATSPFVVAGMHRSGTSLVASYLANAGVEMGERLLAADARNQRGYFEDAEFVEFHGRVFRACTRRDDAGHRDWGWTESEAIDRSALLRFRAEAAELLARRADARAAWGWKDPRTTVLLDFWDELRPDARYVLVYRFPWEVADSLQRIRENVFLDHPEYAYRIWTFYNRRLLEFHRSHRERCILVSVDALTRRGAEFRAVLARRLGLTLPADVFDGFDRDLLASIDGRDPLIPLVRMAFPECTALLAELDGAADVSSAGDWSAEPRAHDGDHSGRKLTVVTPCRDDGVLLIDAIASVERDDVDGDLVVVDDGSTEPRTRRLLDALEGHGYRVVRQPPSGLSAARNTGFRHATTPYVLPLDADNRMRKGFARSAIERLDRDPGVAVVYGDRYEFGKRTGVVEVPDFELARLLAANYIDACAVVRRDAWDAVGGYDPRLPFFEDWDFWLSAAEKGFRFVHLAEPGFDYRVRPRSLSVDFSEAEDARRERVLAYVVWKHRASYRAHRDDIPAAARDGHLRAALEGIAAGVTPGAPCGWRELDPSWPDAPAAPAARIAWLEGRLAAVERALARRSRELRRLQSHSCFEDLRALEQIEAGLPPSEEAGGIDDLDDEPVVRRADVESCMMELWKSNPPRS